MKLRIAVACVVLFASPANAQELRIGTAPQGSIGFNIGTALTKVLTQAEKQASRVQPLAGSSAIIPLVNTGEIDLTVANTLEVQEAIAGWGPYAGRRQANIRVLAAVFPLHAGVFVKKDSPIRSIADLKGQRVTYGYTAQLTLNRVLDAILANGGIDSSLIKAAVVPNVTRGADDFVQGKADAGFFAVGAGKLAEVDKAVGGIRFLPLLDDPNAIAAMQKIFRYAYVKEVQPRPAFAGVVGPTKLMAYDYLVISSTHLKPEVAYRVVKALHQNKDQLAASLAAFRDFDPAAMQKLVPALYHPGAQKYYKEKGVRLSM